MAFDLTDGKCLIEQSASPRQLAAGQANGAKYEAGALYAESVSRILGDLQRLFRVHDRGLELALVRARPAAHRAREHRRQTSHPKTLVACSAIQRGDVC